eukprot:TRINITY_DN49481_c0_g1_i1.p1 TRINITY_DN49481_c0_g1~~TRINITY_DN49481_c0_g1_i1.p1  ORF type:complete len:330 (+),score=63.22 TRINITY_DN49481_c0_g1_i1:73-1062(+)
MEAQDYSLVWNEFMNFTIETFKYLLQDMNFSDVTLVCENGKQIDAHKAVLASCSSFFRQILVNNPHSKPLIILQGISYQNLDSIIKFMYLGQAQIPQADLKSFLAASKLLKVKGINNEMQDFYAENNAPEVMKIKTEVLSTFEEQAADVSVYVSEDPENHSFDSEMTDIQHDVLEVEYPIEATLKQENIDTYDTSSSGKKKTMFYCDKCDYKASYSVSVKYHHQTVHEGVRFNCDQCEAFFTRKESLKTHIRSIHEGIRYPCDLCEYKATESGALKKHKISQHGRIDVKYSCDICNFGAKTGMQLKLHMASKHKKKSEAKDLMVGHSTE